MPDQLSSLYSEFLEGGYDCVDRVVLNAYFSMGQSGGGFRVWWRELYGSDENLDDNHLMRMAGRFSRRLRAWAKANSVPVIYCSPGEDKHKMGEQHLATHEGKCGLFLVLVSKAPALVWEAQKTGTGKLGQLVPKDPWPYVNHYSFHILDPDWGHVTIKMSGHPPFGAQVILNGHEYVAAQAQKAKVEFTKHENCFTSVSNPTGLAKIADTLSQKETAERLRQFCERWIYSVCLCFCAGPGRAGKEQISISVLRVSVGVQPESAVPLRPADGGNLPGIDRPDPCAAGPGSDQDHLWRQESPASGHAKKESHAMGSRGRDTYV